MACRGKCRQSHDNRPCHRQSEAVSTSNIRQKDFLVLYYDYRSLLGGIGSARMIQIAEEDEGVARLELRGDSFVTQGLVVRAP